MQCKIAISNDLTIFARLTALILSVVATFGVIAPANAGSLKRTVLGVPCAQVHARHIDRQLNLRASRIMVGCGMAPGGGAHQSIASISGVETGASMERLASGPSSPVKAGGANIDIDVITGGETSPHVVQAETMFARNGNVVLVGYNDSRDIASTPINISGISRSTDGGNSFTRILPSPFASGHGGNYGDPLLVYNRRLGVFIATWLAPGCGGQGLGAWTSIDGLRWSASGCAHVGSADDRASMWVDNNPASSFYGRIYVSFNDFGVGNGQLSVVHSDDASTWSSPVRLVDTATFIRDVQITVSPGSDGRVYLMGMNEGGGGFANRQNLIFYSTDGGATWTQVTIGSPFAASGDTTCGYFVAQHPIWRDMGWGQPATGANGLVAYDYTVHGAGSDTGDIFFTRSTDYGATWAAPIKLNLDSGGAAQWQPSLVVTASGQLVASWYDRRNSTDGSNYEIFYRFSDDGGLTWQPEVRLSTRLIPQPLQQDTSVQACFAGDYNYAIAYNDTVHFGWTDGRVSIAGNPQEDVFVHQLTSLTEIPVLYDQYNSLDVNNTMGIAAISKVFASTTANTSQGADDFVVPSGTFWNIVRVDAPGFSSSAPPQFNVFLYRDAGGVPGTQIFAQTGITPLTGVPADGGFGDGVLLPLTGTGWLGAGHYWISVQNGNLNDNPWYFYLRTTVSNSPGVWQNPNNGFGTGCTSWAETNACVGTQGVSDFGFRLRGYQAPSKE